MSLPNILYVYEDTNTNGETYLVATTDPGEQTEGLIGVYALREKLHVRHQLQFRRPRTKQWFRSGK